MFFKNQSGMTLIEVMVALVILCLVTIPLLSFFVTSNRLTVEARQRVEAVNYAQQLLEEIKGLPYDQVGRVAGEASENNVVHLDPNIYDDSFLRVGAQLDYIIEITSGPGSGQIRKLTGYDGGGLATVSPAWDAGRIPNASSSYVVLRNGELGKGLVREAGSNTVTLAEDENNIQDFYRGWFIEICGGKGSGQVRRVVGYDPENKVATVEHDWSPVPDATSIYRLYRYRYEIKIENQDGSDELKKVTVTVYYRIGSMDKAVSLATDKLRS